MEQWWTRWLYPESQKHFAPLLNAFQLSPIRWRLNAQVPADGPVLLNAAISCTC